MILVTGGAGYIGSHTLIELAKGGYDFVVYDNLSNASEAVLGRIEEIIGKKVAFVKGDIRDRTLLDRVFERYDIDSVIHFAGLKAVGESVEKPLLYYDNNVSGTVTLLEAMQAHGCKKIVFSSSATVYGEPEEMPIKEHFPTGATTNPYGRSKYIIEEILKDLHKSDPSWQIVILRYFNPIGAHESGRIGEDPEGIPNNLMPYISQVAVGKLECLRVFGDDYDTHDGTGVRDYIHVVDLADAHVKAVAYMEKEGEENPLIVNLGTGTGYSVLDVVQAFEKASGRKIAYEIAPRRTGDIAVCYADATKAKESLGWEAKYDIAKMCEDSWRWQKNNPMGYI